MSTSPISRKRSSTPSSSSSPDIPASSPSSAPTHSSPTRKPKRNLRYVLAFAFLASFFCLLLGYRYIYQRRPVTDLGDLEDTAKPGNENQELKEGSEMGVPKVNVGYFVNWGIYARKFPPQCIPAQSLTHILYAFADVRPDSGEVFLTDAWADEQIHYEGDSWNDQGTNLYGNFKQLYLLKLQHRHLKVILSIGGWTYSSHFAPAAADPTRRRRFVETGVQLVENYGLDGLDIDWEYPENDGQAKDYVSLLRELRQGLDEQAKKKGCSPYLLTIAAPCGPSKYQTLRIKEMDQYLDFWNLMAYDYSGNWESTAGHQANLHGSKLSSELAVGHYVSHGAPAHKLVLGVPLYGRCFQNTDGPGKPFQGVGQGSWEQGSYDYKVLPLPNASEHEDASQGASWSYDPSKREFITYDTPNMASLKTRFVRDKGLRGAMYWELSGDRDAGDPRAIVPRVAYELGELDGSENHLDYPESKFDNLRAGMQ